MDRSFDNRKIIHVDMDAFYASVEQRDQPEYLGRPLVVASINPRSVVCAASYEARKYGIRSAMPFHQAKRRCDSLIQVPPNFKRYKEVSETINTIFNSYTNKVERLSLDEAYLDVTDKMNDIPTATGIAIQIKREIKKMTGLTASAGVAPNKFLAKIASDWNKPDGLFIIKPHHIPQFIEQLPLRKIVGVGGAMESKLASLNINTMKDLQNCPLDFLIWKFGKFGYRLYLLAKGRDESPVRTARPRKSLSKERTFTTDLCLEEIEKFIPELVSTTYRELKNTKGKPRTFSVKIRTSDFKTLSRQMRIDFNCIDPKYLEGKARELLARLDETKNTQYRLLGTAFSNFVPDTKTNQKSLF